MGLYMEKIQALNIKKSFGKRQILHDVSIEVNRGEIVALLGPNGSGKTSLFYIISGLIYAEGGKIILNDEDVTLFPMYKRAQMGIGYLPQDNSIFRKMSVEDNIDCVLELYYPDKNKRKKRLDEIIETFSISHIRKSPALALSGGERRRVEIARTIASNPKFVLLDEPFAGVDPIAIRDLRTLILALKNLNIGVLITDHNVKETLMIVDRAYILYEGKILFQGNQEEITKNDLVKEIYLGDNFIE
jgi:lipopolysaccharide export system ATP-binding protein